MFDVCLVFGVCVVFGVWRPVFGSVCCVVFGVRYLMLGVLCFVFDVRCSVFGARCLVFSVGTLPVCRACPATSKKHHARIGHSKDINNNMIKRQSREILMSKGTQKNNTDKSSVQKHMKTVTFYNALHM